MKRTSRLLVSGYYGFGNAGDEAILAGLVEGFREIAPEVELTVLSGDPAATAAEHGVEAVPRGLTGVRSHLRLSDLLVSGGGGLLQDATSWRSPLYYLGIIRLARAAGLPVACIGHGIGPLNRRWVRWLVRRTLSDVDVLAVRDRSSLDMLHALGVTRPTEATADLAFVMTPPTETESLRAWEKAGLRSNGDPKVALALRHAPGAGAADLPASLAAGVAAACEDLKADLVMVPMQRPGDLEFGEVVAREMSTEVAIVRAPLTAWETLALFRGFDLVIATRLHGLIFAAICGVPAVAISYDPKIDAMMGELGLSVATSTSAFDRKALAAGVRDAWEVRAGMTGLLSDRAGELRAAALRNISLVASLLSEAR